MGIDKLELDGNGFAKFSICDVEIRIFKISYDCNFANTLLGRMNLEL